MVCVWGERGMFVVGEEGRGGMFGEREEWGEGGRFCFLVICDSLSASHLIVKLRNCLCI